MNYIITNAVASDLPQIYKLFEEAILFQKINNYTGWLSYDKEYIKEDVKNNLLFKIIHQGDVVCIFSVCYSDVLIWREMEKGDAIYLHRVVLNRSFKQVKIFGEVLKWAIKYTREKQLKYIRMDTWSQNEKIIRYYKSYGFSFIENCTTPDTKELPLQHRKLNVALLQFCVSEL
jgi:ribosomal protein S18 acetylase RimI-like enzyme